MYTKKLLISLFITVFLSACGGSDGVSGSTGNTIQKSSDINYTKVDLLSSNVNDATAIDAGAEISSTGLELFFQSTRAGGEGSMDIWVATRNSVTDLWGAATNLGATVNSTSIDFGPTLSDDGLTLIFSSSRAGGQGSNDLYMITRTAIGNAWSAPVNLGNVVNTVSSEAGPELSKDGLSLYFFSDRAGGSGGDDIYVSTRASLVDDWEAATNLGSIVNSSAIDSAPSIASDGLTLYFHTDRDGGAPDIWRTTRPTELNDWTTPEVLSSPVNDTSIELAPSISNDFKTLYFSSDRSGNRDIWRATP